jgi:hypothetical protein
MGTCADNLLRLRVCALQMPQMLTSAVSTSSKQQL